MDWHISFFRKKKIGKKCLNFRIKLLLNQSYQYKILNRILNCNDRLFRWKIKAGRECDFCGMTDTLEHRLFECTEEKQIWDSLQSWNSIKWSVGTLMCQCATTVLQQCYFCRNYKQKKLEISYEIWQNWPKYINMNRVCRKKYKLKS